MLSKNGDTEVRWSRESISDAEVYTGASHVGQCCGIQGRCFCVQVTALVSDQGTRSCSFIVVCTCINQLHIYIYGYLRIYIYLCIYIGICCRAICIDLQLLLRLLFP